MLTDVVKLKTSITTMALTRLVAFSSPTAPHAVWTVGCRASSFTCCDLPRLSSCARLLASGHVEGLGEAECLGVQGLADDGALDAVAYEVPECGEIVQ